MLALVIVSFITSLVSGIFGMAGGILMMGFLVWTFPVATAAVLHGFIQASSNASRAWAVRSHILWIPVVNVIVGVSLAFIVFQILHVNIEKAWVYLILGMLPPSAYFLQSVIKPSIENPWHQIWCGTFIGVLMFTAGVSGPIMDIFFAQTKLDRFEQVATKAILSLFSHFFKVAFFWTLFADQVRIPVSFWTWFPFIILVSTAGSFLGKSVLKRIKNQDFQVYVWRLLFGVSAVYLAKGIYAL